MNAENKKTNEPHKFRLTVDTLNLKDTNKNMALENLRIYCTWKNIKSEHKFKISASTWNDEFHLPDGSYLISDFQGHFEYILKNMKL